MEIILNILTLFLVILLKPCFFHEKTGQYWTFQLTVDFSRKNHFFANLVLNSFILLVVNYNSDLHLNILIGEYDLEAALVLFYTIQ